MWFLSVHLFELLGDRWTSIRWSLTSRWCCIIIWAAPAVVLIRIREANSSTSGRCTMSRFGIEGSEAGANKLTAPEEQKAVEKPNGKKIQFADKIVKSTITPGAKK
ncbi:hypothetical protein B9Z55_014759 [Caenorhabditis nigoni]|uniref:Uncharacterized protein n=1 Tax=Caenorhabditis nigoni TaxID=1611254 RepID=A0A2G5U779_9PELO|nr:hypothetical protein B9Z55_014759 [Caenorhabditis nigoni]